MTDEEDSPIPEARTEAPKAARPSWLTDAYPEFRPGPPWVMEEMMASEPDLVMPILSNPAAVNVARMILAAHQSGQPIVTTGCGTSEHGALAIATLVEAGLSVVAAPGGRVECRQAFDQWLEPRARGVLVAVSHDGGTAATVAAIKAARSAGATTVLITARADAPAGRVADHLLVTPQIDRSWCHTVAYMSSILAGAALAGAVCGENLHSKDLRDFLHQIETGKKQASEVAHALADCSRLIITGLGADLISARELALKIEEGARLPAVAMHLETLLHGHLAATDARTGMVFVLCAKPGSQRRDLRARLAAAAAGRIGIRCAAILAVQTDFLETLTNAGRIVLPPEESDRGGIEALAFALAGSAVALQQLALALAHERGSNPDLIRREQEPYREAARIAEQGTW
ncbi:MAG: SIS domain-containing protein [Terriglobia bacterium]